MAVTKYVDQKWSGGTPIDGEQLSVNGYYTGEHLGTPTQGKNETDANADAHYVEHNTIRFGTIMQDGDSNANMPTVATSPTITTASLPSGTQNTAYNQTLQATGSTPITWKVTTGTLPTGLSLAENTGAITGTPTVVENKTFTVTATNSAGSTSKQFSINIAAAGK